MLGPTPWKLMAFCDDFVCPFYYKCHQSYCIQTYRVCDGISDCPDDEDEVKNLK